MTANATASRFGYLWKWAEVVERAPSGMDGLRPGDRVLLDSAGVRAPESEELATARRARARYRATEETIRARAPNLLTVKGGALASRYPDPLVRYQSDLDLAAPTRSDVWQAVAPLLDEGFEVYKLSLFRRGGDIGVVIRCVRTDPALPAGAESVEFTTVYTAGRDWVVAPLPVTEAQRLAEPVRQLLALSDEFTQQNFRLRDVFDASLLLEETAADDAKQLFDVAQQLGLEREVAALAELVAKCVRRAGGAESAGLRLLCDRAATILEAPWRQRPERALRLIRGARSCPVETFHQRMLLDERRRRRRDRRILAGLTRPAVRIDRTWDSGLPIFGLPISDKTDDDVRIQAVNRRRTAMVMSLPVGSFLFVASDEVREKEIRGYSEALG